MATNITIFSKKQGDLRGVAIEMVDFKGKPKRIAHAILDSKMDSISIDLPKKVDACGTAHGSLQPAVFRRRIRKAS